MVGEMQHLVPIAIAGFFSVMIIIERFYALYIRYPINVNKFLSELRQRVFNGNIAGAIQFCSDQKNTPGSRIAKAGLIRASRDIEQIMSSVEIEATKSIGLVKKRVGYLAMLANVATLLGLLGTIFGLIQSFGAISSVDVATKSQLLAEGISTAMYATAGGLAVAIPTMIAYSFLQSKSNRLVEHLETIAMSVVDMLNSRIYKDEADMDEVDFVKDKEQSLSTDGKEVA